MISMSTPKVIIRLLIICTVIFIPPRYAREAEYTETFYYPRWNFHLKDQLNEVIETTIQTIESRYRSEDIILSNVSRLTIGSPAHGQLINSMPSKNDHSASRTAEILIEASTRLIHLHNCPNQWQCAVDLSIVNLTETIFGEMCMSEYKNSNLCTGKNLDYRSPDGSCNNLKRNFLGKANTAYKRLLFANYIDGISEMPKYYEKKLPDPRLVSTNLVKDKDSPDLTKTMMMAYWTMFIGHDLSHTAVSTMGTDHRFVSCCDKNRNLQYEMMKHIKSCKPIYVPVEDRICKSNPLHCLKCMNYVRSRPAMRTNCTLGPMEQMNQATHYLDASMIYGTSEQQTLSLRQMSLGLLSVRKIRLPSSDLLPLDTSDSNYCQDGPGTCHRAGDIRANAYPQLNAVYTMWVREHNFVARELYKENLFRSDEEIFREAKKIVTACIQHITYNEWLPALLGVNYTKENGLGLGQRTMYDVNADPTVSNSFATAILPFANSMIGDSISVNTSDNLWQTPTYKFGQYGTLKGNYNKPLSMEESTENMLTGLTVQATQKVDLLFTESITNYLYVIDPSYNSHGMDIVSLDIQRSRDHGIPSYTKFRKYCGLKAISNVQDLSEIMVEGSADKLLKLYKTWDDIDLLVGALSEKHADDAMVGPTMRCIIREQFVRTRIADRYFYDVPGVFTDYQLEKIKRVTLARVLCDSGDIVMMIPQAFSRPVENSEAILHCTDTKIPELTFSGWFDKTRDDFFG